MSGNQQAQRSTKALTWLRRTVAATVTGDPAAVTR